MTTQSDSNAGDKKANLANQDQSLDRGDAYNFLVLRDIRQMCGPPPVLSTESVKAYDQMLLRTIQCLRPRDFMERMFIKHLTDCNWEIIRYTRHKALHLDRKHRQLRENRSRHAKKAAHGLQAADAVLSLCPTESDLADALEQGIDYAERLDKLLNLAIARRDDVLRQMELYREGLGRDYRHAADDIIMHGYSRHGKVIWENEPYFTSDLKAFLKEMKPVDNPAAAFHEQLEEMQRSPTPENNEAQEPVPASTPESKEVEEPVPAPIPAGKQAQPPSASLAGGNDDLGS